MQNQPSKQAGNHSLAHRLLGKSDVVSRGSRKPATNPVASRIASDSNDKGDNFVAASAALRQPGTTNESLVVEGDVVGGLLFG